MFISVVYLVALLIYVPFFAITSFDIRAFTLKADIEYLCMQCSLRLQLHKI